MNNATAVLHAVARRYEALNGKPTLETKWLHSLAELDEADLAELLDPYMPTGGTTTPDLDATVRLVTEAVDEIRDNLAEVFAPLITALGAVDTEAVHAIRDRLRYGDADTAETWTGPVPTEYRVSPPQSTEPDEQPTRDVSGTPITIDVAEAWLLADHDERVTAGTVRPATERARELINQLRGPIVADVAWDLRRVCRRQPGHTCGHRCDLDATACLLEHLADELNRDAAMGTDRD